MKKWLIAFMVVIPLSLFGALLALSAFSGVSCTNDPGATTSVRVTVDGSNITINGKPPTVEQTQVAEEIIGQGRARKLSDRDITIALTTGYQESKLRNLRYGDGDQDSLGVFQQRPSVKAWGTAEEILNIPHAVGKFYNALEAIKNREQMTDRQVAEAVQRPNPTAYGQRLNRFTDWIPFARALLGVATGNFKKSSTTSTPQCAIVADPGSSVPRIAGVAFGSIGSCPGGTNAGIGTYVGGQKLQLCSVNGVVVEAGISVNLQAMFDTARADGIILGGSGYRSYQRQVELRRQNCGTSDYAIWQMPSSQCSPHTAIPGQSNHEKGRAVDLRSQYGGMHHGDQAHSWMLRNGPRFGFEPYPVEPWHWNG